MRSHILALLVSLISFMGAPAVARLSHAATPKRVPASVKEPGESPRIDRLVLAFYYPWYGTPDSPGGNGKWIHWEGVDRDKKAIASSTNYPVGGPYDSMDGKVIERHCREAKGAGIDGFIVSWWGAGTLEDRALPRVLDACGGAGIKACIYYETIRKGGKAKDAAEEIRAVIKAHGEHRAWLKVDKRPVVFVYGRAIEQLGIEGWTAVVEELKGDGDSRPVLIGDSFDAKPLKLFDGPHHYGPMGGLAKEGEDKTREWAKRSMTWWVGKAREERKIACVTVFPGYDDTKIRKPGLKVGRREGATYRTLWEEAIGAKPDWVLITSWNEWHEGSEIEASVEYGAKYLEMTGEFSKRFKGADEKP